MGDTPGQSYRTRGPPQEPYGYQDVASPPSQATVLVEGGRVYLPQVIR